MYELILTLGAERDLERLDGKIRKQIRNRFEWLCKNCDQWSHKALKGNYKGKFKLPSGNYRIIYTYDRHARIVEVSRIRHRSSVYERP